MTHSSCQTPLFVRSALALGRDDFPRHLAAALRSVGGVDHLLIHAFHGSGQAALCLSTGMLDKTVQDFTRQYVRGIYTMDPFYPEICALRPGEIGDLLELESNLSWVFKSRLMDPQDIRDIHAFGIATPQVTYHVQLLRVARQPFTKAQTEALRSCIRVVAELVSKNAVLTAPPPRFADIDVDVLIEGYTASVRVGGREQEICKGIIGGSSSSQIAKRLEISVNTVQTYRKRLYQRLGISTQHELFERVLCDVLDTTALAS